MIGKKLRLLYTTHMVTRETLSQAINVHPRTIVQWEKDESDPNLENLCLIADFFKVSLDEILDIEPRESISLSSLASEDKNKLMDAAQAFITSCIRNSRK